MYGQKGLAIVITALLLTVCIGYLFNASEEETTATDYVNVADMDAIFYNDSSRVSGTSVYNPPTNVTDWTPNSGVPTTTTASQYLISSGTAIYGANQALGTLHLENLGFVYTDGTVDVLSSNTIRYGTNSDSVYYTGGRTYTNNQEIIGGKSVDNAGGVLKYYLNDAVLSEMYIVNLKTFLAAGTVDITAHDKIRVSLKDNDLSGTPYYNGYWEASFNNAVGSTTNIKFYGDTIDNADYAIYSSSSDSWAIYDADDNKIAIVENIYIQAEVSGNAQLVGIQYKFFVSSTDPVYADPTQLVNLTNLTATWNANTDQNFTSISVVFEMEASSSVYVSEYFDGNSINNIYFLTNSGSKLTAAVDTIGDYPTFSGALVVFDFINKTITTTGILEFSDVSPRLNYTLAPNSYSYTLEQIQPADYLSFTATGGVKAAIVETEIISDPDGVLWNNFNVNLNNYFPDYINGNNEGVRVQLGGFVSYGDSITIGGNTYPVTNGTINVPLVIDGVTRNKDMKLSGLAIDYRADNHTYLVFTDNLNREVDLGATANNYTIAGAGTWYFSATFNTIEEKTVNDWVWSTDWSLTSNATCLVFLGLSILGLVIGLWLGRGQFELYDWIILIIADIIALTLMVV